MGRTRECDGSTRHICSVHVFCVRLYQCVISDSLKSPVEISLLLKVHEIASLQQAWPARVGQDHKERKGKFVSLRAVAAMAKRPALAHGDERKKEIIAAIVRRIESARAPYVCQRIDREGAVKPISTIPAFFVRSCTIHRTNIMVLSKSIPLSANKTNSCSITTIQTNMAVNCTNKNCGMRASL